MPKLLKPPKAGRHRLAPTEITIRAARHLANASKGRGKSTAELIREAIDLAEQIEAGNVRIVVAHREAYDRLQKKQGRA